MLTAIGQSQACVIALGILVFASEAIAERNWIELSSFQSTEDSGTLVDIGCAAASLDVGLFKLSQTKKSRPDAAIEIRAQRFPQELGAAGVFYIEPENPTAYSIKVRQNYQSGVEFDPCVRIQNIDHSKHGDYLNVIQIAMANWSLTSRLEMRSALQKMQFAVPSLPTDMPVYEPLIITTYWMLLELEEFADIKQQYERNKLDFDAMGVPAKEQIELIYLIALRQLGEFDNAESIARNMLAGWEAKEGLAKYRQLKREIVRNELATILMMSGAFRGIPSKMKEAQEIFALGIERARELGDKRLEAMLLNHVSPFYFEQDRYDEAEQLILESIKLHEQVGSRRLLADALNNLARLYQSNEKIEKAISALSRALEIENDFSEGEKVATLQLHLARLYTDIGDFSSAELYYSSSLEVFSSVENFFYRAIAQKGLGQAQLGKDENKQGLLNLNSALEYFAENNYPRFAFHTSIDIARHYIEKSAVVNVLSNQEFSNALEIIDKFDSGAPSYEREKVERWMLQAELKMHRGGDTEYELFEGLLEEFFLRGDPARWRNEKLRFIDLAMRYRLSQGRYDEIDNFANQGYQIVEQVSRSLSSSNLGAKWSNRISEIVDLHSQGLLRQWRVTGNGDLIDNIFELGEKYQSTHYRRQKILASSADLNNSNFIEQDTRVTIANILNVVNADTEEERRHARKEYLKSDLKLDESKQDIDHVDAQAYSTIRHVQASMAEQDVVFRFVVRQYSSFIIIIQKEKWIIHDLPSKSLLTDLVRQTLGAASEQSNDVTSWVTKLSNALSIQKEFLQNKSKLIYLADGPLELFPISLLNWKDDNGNSEAIIDSMDVVRIRSLSEYFEDISMQADEVLREQDIAIFADPLFKKESLGNGSIRANFRSEDALRSWTKTLSRLPGSAREAAAIRRVFPAKNVVSALGSVATNSTFLSEEFRHSKVLHIATHGYFNSSSPNIVGLATSYDSKSEVNNGFLSMAEIAEYKFSSNLVVISGCETLLGENINGEGLIGLDRSLMQQGAGSVIATHWAIPDGSTAYFMKLFYQNLKRNSGNTSLALSQSKRLMKTSARYSHPFHWSAFTLTSANQSYDSDVFR